ncbi:MAG: DUF4395 domain-containing protein [Polyangiaceae bacterium]|nr:DUF4395 domain-containing protein [Polyangiaceae bacterium]
MGSQTNDRSARVLAACILVTIAAAWSIGARWVLPVLAVGFVVRALWGPRYSMLARLASAVANRLGPVRLVSAAPKRFAQAIGAGCLTLSSLGGYPRVGWAIGGAVALFAALEATLGFCFGCWLYGTLAARGLMQPDICVDCVRPAGGVDSPSLPYSD